MAANNDTVASSVSNVFSNNQFERKKSLDHSPLHIPGTIPEHGECPSTGIPSVENTSRRPSTSNNTPVMLFSQIRPPYKKVTSIKTPKLGSLPKESELFKSFQNYCAKGLIKEPLDFVGEVTTLCENLKKYNEKDLQLSLKKLYKTYICNSPSVPFPLTLPKDIEDELHKQYKAYIHSKSKESKEKKETLEKAKVNPPEANQIIIEPITSGKKEKIETIEFIEFFKLSTFKAAAEHLIQELNQDTYPRFLNQVKTHQKYTASLLKHLKEFLEVHIKDGERKPRFACLTCCCIDRRKIYDTIEQLSTFLSIKLNDAKDKNWDSDKIVEFIKNTLSSLRKLLGKTDHSMIGTLQNTLREFEGYPPSPSVEPLHNLKI